MAQLTLAAIFLILALCIVFSIIFDKYSALYWIGGAIVSIGIIYLSLDLRQSYLLENMTKEDLFEIKNQAYMDIQTKAFDYVLSEECGSVSRFERRYGRTIYLLFIEKGIIEHHFGKNRWQKTDYADQLQMSNSFVPTSLEK